jgi:ferredoxin
MTVTLTLRPGQVKEDFDGTFEIFMHILLLPWFIASAVGGEWRVFLAPTVCLVLLVPLQIWPRLKLVSTNLKLRVGALGVERFRSRTAFLSSLLAAVILGRAESPLAFVLAGMAAGLVALRPGVFAHAFLPAALAGALWSRSGLLLDWHVTAAPLPQGEIIFETVRAITLLPAAYVAVRFRQCDPYRALVCWIGWLLTVGIMRLALPSGVTTAFFTGGSFLPALPVSFQVWFVFSIFLASKFIVFENRQLSVLLVAALGLLAVLGPLPLVMALALPVVIELARYFKVRRVPKAHSRGRAPDRSSVMASAMDKSHAQATSPGEAPPGETPPGGELPGDDLSSSELIAVRLCDRGYSSVKYLAAYEGPPGCAFMALLDGGPLECEEACLGQGDCAAACPRGAIGPVPADRKPETDHYAWKSLPPKIDAARCRGCGLCVASCPKNLLTLRPRSAAFVVRCRGSATMRDMDSLCRDGCLGCGRCRKACPAGAIEKLGHGSPPPVNDGLCLAARPECGLACRNACPRNLPQPAMGNIIE